MISRHKQWISLLWVCCALGPLLAQSVPAPTHQSENHSAGVSPLSPAEFAVIEGLFHDGLGTFAELSLANELLTQAQSSQPLFDSARAQAKMRQAILRLPAGHSAGARFTQEQANIAAATQRGAALLLARARPQTLVRVRHTALEFANANAADLRLEFTGGVFLPVSVKTEKSNKVAVAEGQTPDLGGKWAARYFQVSPAELEAMMRTLGFASLAELKANYLNVAQLVAQVLIVKLGLEDCQPTDFSRARVTNLAAAKYLLRQLLKFKHGNDGSTVIVFDRGTGEVTWETKLDAIDIERLTADRISFRPSRPRNGAPIASEFGLKIDGQAVVTFQIKHKRGKARDTERRYEFSDLTTRLIL